MKRHAPATARNSAPIAAVLAQELPDAGTVLEIASGSGEHAVFLARRFPDLTWLPSDADPQAIASIEAWGADEGAENLRAPMLLDAAASDWPISSADAVLCINMVHISPWAATEGLFRQAAAILPADAPLIVYGPFFEPEIEPAQSNLAFDASLRSRDSCWGVRKTDALERLANETGFKRSGRYDMPANNLVLVYRAN